MPCTCAGIFPRKEGRIQVLIGLALSSQTVGSLLRIPWLAKLSKKIDSTEPIFIYLQTYF
jgi:hypothetical protein